MKNSKTKNINKNDGSIAYTNPNTRWTISSNSNIPNKLILKVDKTPDPDSYATWII